jgi:hypothetical protein
LVLLGFILKKSDSNHFTLKSVIKGQMNEAKPQTNFLTKGVARRRQGVGKRLLGNSQPDKLISGKRWAGYAYWFLKI